MKSIDYILKKEKEKLLLRNKQNIEIYTIIKEINVFLEDILNNKNQILSELKENFLTPTLVFLGKIEKIHEIIKKNNIEEYIIPLDFNIIDYNEFTEYYDFVQNEDNNSFGFKFGDTTSLFNLLYKSIKHNGVYMLHQEVYEHEDDTDDGLYYLILKK